MTRNKFGNDKELLKWHWHGLARYWVGINDPRCPVCNADGHLGEAIKVQAAGAEPRKEEL